MKPETAYTIVTYFGLGTVILTAIVLLLKRTLENLINKAIAWKLATLVLRGVDVDWDHLKELYKQEVGGDLKNYEAVAITNHARRILENGEHSRIVDRRRIFRDMTDTIPGGSNVDPEYGCGIMLAVPLLLGLNGLRSALSTNPVTWSAGAGYAALIVVVGLLCLLGDVVCWGFAYRVLRKSKSFSKEYEVASEAANTGPASES